MISHILLDCTSRLPAFLLLTLAVILAGCVVSFAGLPGFIRLIIPQIRTIIPAITVKNLHLRDSKTVCHISGLYDIKYLLYCFYYSF